MTMTETVQQDVWASASPARVRFTQRERRGVFMGRTGAQLVVSGSALAGILFLAITAGYDRAAAFIFMLVGVIVVGIWMHRGIPVITLIAQSISYLLRAMQGQTKFQRSVWWRITTKPIPTGTTGELIPIPEVVKHETLPGGLGDIAYVNIPSRGGFVLNKREQLVSASVRVISSAWPLRDEGVKEQIYHKFAGWLSSTESLAGLHEVTMRVRVDRAAATELADYVASRDEVRETTISEEVQREYATLIAQEANRSMEFTNTITLSFDLAELSSAIRRSGGGLLGISAVIADQVELLKQSLDDLYVKFDAWLDAEELEGMTSTGLDPISAARRREHLGTSKRELRTRPPVMDGQEHRDRIEFDESVHQTLWIHEWPRTAVSTGFLQKLLYAGDSTRCLTIQFKPVPLDVALKELNNAQIDMNTADRVRETWGARTGIHHEQERNNLLEREKDLSDGFTDERFRGFLTISGESVSALDRDRSALEQAGFGCGVRMSVLYNQQWASLVTSVLPIPTRSGRRKK
ncbi:SCO6880 family protein [Microbacterium sp. YY-01]|uniref:SCO6880 family protein n=1 Tax=Microbacterium sp. YY-01 TaxID=3421634 RepID=UPI003D173984